MYTDTSDIHVIGSNEKNMLFLAHLAKGMGAIVRPLLSVIFSHFNLLL
jgi:hypothetical protein